MKSFLSTLREIFRFEKSLFERFPRLRFAAHGVLFVPALYTLIYLSSVWDPNSKTSALPVGIVNQDAGIKYYDQVINVGDDLVRGLKRKDTFGYRHFSDPEVARKQVRDGRLAFALIVPRDFSEHAVPGSRPGAAKLTIYTSEGNNYASAGFAKRFAPEVAHRVNEALNEKRWELVLSSATGSKENLGRLKEAISQLRTGAGDLHVGLGEARAGSADLGRGAAQLHESSKKLDAGAKELNNGVTQLSTGMKQLNAGIHTMDAKRPSDAELKSLKDGARDVAKGQAELSKGLEQLHGGAVQLTDGLDQLRETAGSVILVGDRIVEAAGELHGGASQLTTGLDKAREAGTTLAAGTARLDEGVGKLTEGARQAGNSWQTLSAKLPDDARLNTLANGSRQLAQGMGAMDTGAKKLDEGSNALASGIRQLHDGSARLSSGLNAIASSLPAPSNVEGTAPGLAHSVEPALEVVAPVANNGTAFAPNFVSLALWVGAVMTAFLFHFNQLPMSLKDRPRATYVLGKLGIPAVMVLLQATVMFFMLVYVLNIELPNFFSFILTLAASSLTFLAIVMALVRVLGDAGKFAAVFLLIVQLSAAGGVMPMELTSEFFQALHPYLPFTWVVRAFRASLFGAYDGAWLPTWIVIVNIGLFALAVSIVVGKWKFIRNEDYRPAMDI